VPPRRASLVSLLLAAALSCAGCGGSGEGAPPETVTVSLPSAAAVDGTVDGDGTAFPSGQAVRAGDTSANASLRGFLSFPLGAVPPGAVLVSARLRVRQSAVVGTPYATLGFLLVEPVDVGMALDPSDHSAPVLPGTVVVLSTEADLGPRDADVSAAVLAAVAMGRPSVDLRVRFPLATDGDALDGYVEIDDAEDVATGTVPILEVTLQRP
jgi:multidrug efflux pump subunit AcrA (membrane-fusion protein)